MSQSNSLTGSCATQSCNSEEELVDLIAREVRNILQSEIAGPKVRAVSNSGYPLIPIGISNRHVHLTERTFHLLFGEQTEFEPLRPLYQPGEFASKHTITIVGPKMRSIPAVRILGPFRKYDQVELSLTDSIFLGVDPPVANSGSLEKAASLTLVGPHNSIHCEKCAIVANRHIHSTDEEAAMFGLKNGDFCKIRIGGEKGVVFENVLVRTNKNWELQIHLDTDDANAANIRDETLAELAGKM